MKSIFGNYERAKISQGQPVRHRSIFIYLTKSKDTLLEISPRIYSAAVINNAVTLIKDISLVTTFPRLFLYWNIYIFILQCNIMKNWNISLTPRSPNKHVVSVPKKTPHPKPSLSNFTRKAKTSELPCKTEKNSFKNIYKKNSDKSQRNILTSSGLYSYGGKTFTFFFLPKPRKVNIYKSSFVKHIIVLWTVFLYFGKNGI